MKMTLVNETNELTRKVSELGIASALISFRSPHQPERSILSNPFDWPPGMSTTEMLASWIGWRSCGRCFGVSWRRLGPLLGCRGGSVTCNRPAPPGLIQSRGVVAFGLLAGDRGGCRSVGRTMAGGEVEGEGDVAVPFGVREGDEDDGPPSANIDATGQGAGQTHTTGCAVRNLPPERARA